MIRRACVRVPAFRMIRVGLIGVAVIRVGLIRVGLIRVSLARVLGFAGGKGLSSDLGRVDSSGWTS